MKSGRGIRFIFLSAAIISLWAAAQFEPPATRMRNEYKLMSRPAEEGVPPEYILTNALLGGFRGLFLTSLWIRAQDMKNDGKFFEMVDIYNLITKLEPYYANAWAFQAWDLAFNVSVEYQQNLSDRVYWVFRGMELLRNQGIPKNPDEPRLYSELAWIFFFKIGKDMDDAYLLYRQVLARQMSRVMLGTGTKEELSFINKMIAQYPSKEALLASAEHAQVIQTLTADGFDPFTQPDKVFTTSNPAVAELHKNENTRARLQEIAAWVVGQRITNELHMDPAVMLELNERFGNINWMLPQAHSLYWGWLGQKAWDRQHPDEITLTHERMIYFSLIMFAYRGQSYSSPTGAVYGAPDYSFIDSICKYMDERIAFYKKAHDEGKFSSNLTGVMSGYTNFLRSAVFNAYLEGNRDKAKEILAQLKEKSGFPENYSMPLDQFIEKEFSEWIMDMSRDQAIGMVAQYTLNAWRALASQDDKEYQYQHNWAEYLQRYCDKRWNKKDNPNEVRIDYQIPPLEDLEVMTAIQVLTGEVPLGPYDNRGIFAQILSTKRPALWKRIERELQQRMAQNALTPTGQTEQGQGAQQSANEQNNPK